MLSKLINTLAILGAMAIVALALSITFQPEQAKANLARFINPNGCRTASSVSTLSYMTPGTATTTVTCVLGNDGANVAALAIYVQASSTTSTYVGGIEESMDGTTWYPIVANQLSTTSPELSLGVSETFRFQFASSSFGGAAAWSGQATSSKVITVPVRMRQVRAYVGLATTSGAFIDNGAVHMQILPKRED